MKKLIFVLGLMMAMMVSVNVNAQNSYKMENGDLRLYQDGYKKNVVARNIIDFDDYNYEYVIVVKSNGDVYAYTTSGYQKNRIAFNGKAVRCYGNEIHVTKKNGAVDKYNIKGYKI